MSIARQHCQQQPATSSLKRLLIIGIVGLVLLALALLAMRAVDVMDREHAVKKHGEEAQQIRDCLNNNGPNSVWQSRSWRRPNTYIQVCQLNDGRWAIRFIQKAKDKWLEKTSFIVKDGTRAQLEEYLTARAIEILS